MRERKSRDHMRRYYKMSLQGHGNLPTNYEEIEKDRENKTMPWSLERSELVAEERVGDDGLAWCKERQGHIAKSST
jgi:hypothetical protein